jgi:hypothetical protein
VCLVFINFVCGDETFSFQIEQVSFRSNAVAAADDEKEELPEKKEGKKLAVPAASAVKSNFLGALSRSQ